MNQTFTAVVKNELRCVENSSRHVHGVHCEIAVSRTIFNVLGIIIVIASLFIGAALGAKYLPKDSSGRRYFRRGEGIHGTFYFLLALVVLTGLLGCGLLFFKWISSQLR